MISLESKDAFLRSLKEARQNSYSEFIDQIELAKSIYGKRFAEKVWECLSINIDYMGNVEGANKIEEKISAMLLKPLNENENEKIDE